MSKFEEKNSDTFDLTGKKAEVLEEADKNPVTNADFLAAIFHALPEKASSTVTSFDGNPKKANGRQWGNYGKFGAIATPATANNYFCVSSHYPGDDGIVKRKKSHFAALHAIMLDDVGTKVPSDRIGLTPSWSIETSPGNYQFGFILDRPITEAAVADRLMNGIIASGLCDEGASGPTARNARLPVAINGRHEPPFKCRLTFWDGFMRYSVDDLVTALQIELPPAGRPKRPKTPKSEKSEESDDVFVAAPDENPVIVALVQRSLYKKPLGERKHDITCPWVHEHTDAVDAGSAYFEPSDLYPLGGFKCQHSHGAKFAIRHLLEFLAVDPSSARMKPTIRITGGELHRIVDRGERELANGGKHYQRGGLIVSISTDPATNESAILPTSRSALTKALSAVALWQKFDKRADDWFRCDPPERHCGVLFDAQSYDHLLPLAGIARQPYLLPSGNVVSTPGYHADSAVFGVFDSRQFRIAETPSKNDALKALTRLLSLLDEFSFTNDCDKSAAVSLLLTAAIRLTLPSAPMFLVRASVMGSGKSYLCKIATAIATPAPASPVSFPDSEEECAKLLLSLLMKSPAVIEFDDLNTDIHPYDKLKTSITESSITGRILGASKECSVSTRTLFLASGNNVGPVRDMTRRVLTINIDPMCESPATRRFKNPHLLRDVKANRGQYVADALTIVRAWVLAGRPESDIPALASFGDWSDYCRQSLVWLGMPDPASTIFDQMKDDPDAELLNRLMCAWSTEFRTGPAGVRDLVDRSEITPTGELSSVVREIAEERGGFVNRSRLGRWIKRHEGRFIDGRRIIPEKAGRNASAWKVVSASSGSSAFSATKPKVSKISPQEKEVFL